MIKFNKCKLNKYLNIANLILWTGLFISLFIADYNILQLQRMAVGSTFVVVMDVFLDWIGRVKVGDK